jgi:hypothetical protein
LLDIRALRRQFAQNLGLVVPPIRVRDNVQLDPNTYRLLLGGQEIARGSRAPASNWRWIRADQRRSPASRPSSRRSPAGARDRRERQGPRRTARLHRDRRRFGADHDLTEVLEEGRRRTAVARRREVARRQPEEGLAGGRRRAGSPAS